MHAHAHIRQAWRGQDDGVGSNSGEAELERVRAVLDNAYATAGGCAGTCSSVLVSFLRMHGYNLPEPGATSASAGDSVRARRPSAPMLTYSHTRKRTHAHARSHTPGHRTLTHAHALPQERGSAGLDWEALHSHAAEQLEKLRANTRTRAVDSSILIYESVCQYATQYGAGESDKGTWTGGGGSDSIVNYDALRQHAEANGDTAIAAFANMHITE